jgi:serine/threonine protein kinase
MHPVWKVLFVQTKGIVDALKFLYDKTLSAGYIIQRDIKPVNILVRNATFKIGDFGSSRMKEAEETSKMEWGFGADIRVYSRTMNCVKIPMENIGKLIRRGHQRDRNTWMDGNWPGEQEMLRVMLMTIQGMLKVDRLERIESSQVVESLFAISE